MFVVLEHLERLLRLIGNTNRGVDVTLKKASLCISEIIAQVFMLIKTS